MVGVHDHDDMHHAMHHRLGECLRKKGAGLAAAGKKLQDVVVFELLPAAMPASKSSGESTEVFVVIKTTEAAAAERVEEGVAS